MIIKEIPEENYGKNSINIVHFPKIKEMDKEDTPREKAEKFGCGVLSIADLWALILRTGTVGMPITQLCRELMHQNGNKLSTLERRTRKELRQIKGLGSLKAIQIEAVMELIRRYNNETFSNKNIVKTSNDAFNIIQNRIGNIPHEEIWIIVLNRRNQAVKCSQISKGGFSSSLFDIKTIIKEALLENASALILCHNHPSGQLSPSPQDDAITIKCKNACDTIDIKLLDHIIVTSTDFYSYADNGKI